MTSSAKQFAREWFGGVGRGTLLCRDLFYSIFKVKPVWHDVLYQMYFIGVKSSSVVCITGAFTGMVLCAQAYVEFHKIKMDTGVLALVSVGMVSQLGPVMASLMVAGRVGAAIAAELGTMRVTEQIDALETLATNPMKYLVVPRVLAGVIMMPLLVVVADIIGIMGGFVVSTLILNFSEGQYISDTLKYMTAFD